MSEQPEPDRAAAPDRHVPGPDAGSIRRALTRLAVPMLPAEVVTLLVLVGIVALMARMGEGALYVRALYLPLAHLFIAVYTGIGFSNQVAAAISYGRGRPADVAPLAASFARVWLVLSAVVVVGLALAAPGFAAVFDVAPEHRASFIAFVRWMAPAELTQVGFVLCAASLRGFGRPGAGALVSVVSAALQFTGVAVLGLGLGMGVASVPVSVASGSAVGLLLGLALLRRHGLWTPRGSLTWRPEVIGHLVRVGLPVAVTQIILFAGNFGVLWVLRGLGSDTISGFSAAVTFQYLVLMPGIVLGSAIAIVLNQQRGAGKYPWLPTGLRVGMQITALAYAGIALAVWLASGPLGRLLGDSPGVATEVSGYLSIVGLTYLVQGPVLAALVTMEQMGAGPLAVGLNLTYYLAIIGIGWLVVDTSGADGVYRTVAGTNLVGITVVAAGFLVIHRLSRRAPEPAVAGARE